MKSEALRTLAIETQDKAAAEETVSKLFHGSKLIAR